MKYYVSNGSDVIGPYQSDQIPKMLDAGLLSESAQVCLEGTERWVPIMDEFPTVLPEYIPMARPIVNTPTALSVNQYRPAPNHETAARRGADPNAVLIYASQAKSVPLAAIVGIVLPGGGYWFSGNYVSAVLSLIIIPPLYLLFPLGPIIQIAAAIEAALRVKRNNERLALMLGIPYAASFQR